MTAHQCPTCPATVRRSTGLPHCPDCMAVAHVEFKRQFGHLDLNERQRAWNSVFSSVDAVTELVLAGRAHAEAA